MDVRCLNCDAELRGGFCHECGQPAGPLRLTMTELVGHAISETFAADGRTARTAVPLLVRPGYLVRAYLDGRRVRYTSPVKLYLFALLVGFLAFRWVTPDALLGDGDFHMQVDHSGIRFGPGEVVAKPHGTADVPDGSPPPGVLEAEGIMRDWFGHGAHRLESLPGPEASRMLIGQVFDAAPTILSLMIPFFALFTRMLFHRRTYAEQLILALNLHAVALLLFAAAALTGQPLAWLAALLGFETHVLVSFRRVFAVGWLRAAVSTVVVGAVHIFLFSFTLVIAFFAALYAL